MSKKKGKGRKVPVAAKTGKMPNVSKTAGAIARQGR